MYVSRDMIIKSFFVYLFSERFGVHWVNFTHPDRPRIPKKSATELKTIFRDNGFPNTSTNNVVSVITYAFAFIAAMYASLF